MLLARHDMEVYMGASHPNKRRAGYLDDRRDDVASDEDTENQLR